METLPPEHYLDRSRAWVERFVIGLKLCPFAPPVAEQDRIRYAFSEARDDRTLYLHFLRELELLLETEPEQIETTLLVHPFVLPDFLDYNDFLETLDDAIAEADLEGVIQVASFHPEYRFEGEADDDPSNYTNRSPFPILHLLREESLEKVLENYPDPESIPLRNIATMRALGLEKVRAMLAEIMA